MTLQFVSLGCHNLTGGSSYRRSARLVRCALDLGIRRFDVAPSYGLGTAEATLASALGHHRLDPTIEITTKFGILSQRWGAVAAWAREPVRWLRGLRSSRAGLSVHSAPMLHAPATASSSGDFRLTPRAAAERSLRALKIERIPVFLSHEHLDDRLVNDIAESMATLRREGLIDRFGCSGHIESVKQVLRAAGRMATVAQTSVLDAGALPPGLEVRLFNLGSLAHRLVAAHQTSKAVQMLIRTTQGRFESNNAGAALAGAMAWAHMHYPAAVLLVNASTAERLEAVVTCAYRGALREWASEYGPDIQLLARAI